MSATKKLVFLILAVASLLGLYQIRDVATPYTSPLASLMSLQTTPAESGTRNAYMTFLGSDLTPIREGESADREDPYFVMIRMLTYMLLHDPETRTKNSYPFIVMVTEGVSNEKRKRLELDGAKVVEVETIESSWIKTKTARWKEQFAKLNLFAMEEYDKILFMDGDTLLFKSLDPVFDDPATDIAYNLNKTDSAPEDEGSQPLQYVFAGQGGAGGFEHKYPPPARKAFNGGFFVAKPSLAMFDYYKKVMSCEDRFPTKYMEQNMLNYVHRREGNLPWTQLDWRWNTNWAIFNDTRNGLHSLHSKYTETAYDAELHDFALSKRWAMEGYFKHMDAQRSCTG